MRIKGSEMRPETQAEALQRYVHRFTGEHKPKWAYRQKNVYPVQFKNDQDWLEHTYFIITKTGGLSKKAKYCESYPTWPYNPELRKDL